MSSLESLSSILSGYVCLSELGNDTLMFYRYNCKLWFIVSNKISKSRGVLSQITSGNIDDFPTVYACLVLSVSILGESVFLPNVSTLLRNNHHLTPGEGDGGWMGRIT